MRERVALLSVLVLATTCCGGCVERKLLIRSTPSGAPVWLDEQLVGKTPLDHPFKHYGHRRLRVGPLRDEHDVVTHQEKELTVRVAAPWYEVFPIDFFSEVLWPGTLVDEHTVEVTLEAPPADAGGHGEEAAERLIKKAEAFREKALKEAPDVE